MFKQQYREANAKIHAPQSALAQLGHKGKGPHRYGAMQALAACLAVFVLATAAVTLLNTSPQNGAINFATARAVNDYDDLYGYVSTAQAGGSYGYGLRGGAMDDAATSESDTSTQAPQAPNAVEEMGDSDKSYSETNVQVAGVDEADIIKTDGDYIYRLVDNEVVIVKVDGEQMDVVSRIKVGKSGESPMASEIFIYGDRLVVISCEYQWLYYGGDVKTDTVLEGETTTPDAVDEPDTATDGADTSDSEPSTISEPKVAPVANAEPKTYATVYDISDRTAPEKLNTLGQSGSYLTSRMVGGTIYLISSYYVYSDIVRGTPETYVPCVTSGSETTLIAPENIQVFENPETPGYVVAAAIDVDSAAQHQSVKAVLGSAGTVYANSGSLLVAAGQYESEKSGIQKDADGKNVITETYTQKTKLLLFKIDGGSITEKASATIPGALNDQFSMDEYDGVFRIVTTLNTSITRIYTDGEDTYQYESKNTNALYTLDQNLNVLGSIEDVAEGERVYSVRFDGDVGYFVTFRQVDPLFAVDLSDPKSPRILSELKIPGFSDYLHVYQQGLLFGFGQDADAKTGGTQGLKLSMFDVSDPTNVTEVHSKKINADWSEASYNHKAILVDAERSLIAFAAENSYFVYGYDADAGFQLKKEIDMGENYWDSSLRGLFIEDCFYVCSSQSITAYSLSDFGKLGSVKLN